MVYPSGSGPISEDWELEGPTQYLPSPALFGTEFSNVVAWICWSHPPSLFTLYSYIFHYSHLPILIDHNCWGMPKISIIYCVLISIKTEFITLLHLSAEEINNTTKLLPNVSLGYEIFDHCTDTINFPGAFNLFFNSWFNLTSGRTTQEFVRSDSSGWDLYNIDLCYCDWLCWHFSFTSLTGQLWSYQFNFFKKTDFSIFLESNASQ